MKKSLRYLALGLAAAASSSAFAGIPPVNVSVSDTNGHAAYQGRTTAGGTFATGKLQPGDYVVQFSSGGLAKQNYALVISAGKQKVIAEAVASAKFAKGGVAMRIKVPKDANITGQITTGKPGTVVASNARIKIMNGKRYVWVAGETGSNLGGRWVEEGTPEARNSTRLSSEGVQSIQERTTNGGVGN